MNDFIKWVGGSILFALIVIQYSTCNNYKHELEEQNNVLKASQDTIKHFKNKNGENSAQIALLKGDKESLLLAIGKSNKRLELLVKSGASSGTVVEQVTKIDTVTLIQKDTVDGVLFYKNSVANNWFKFDQEIKDDSSRFSIEMKDSISVSFQNVKQGWFKPKKQVVVVSNANPYVQTVGLKSFEVPQKKYKSKLFIGLGIGLGAGYILFK